MQNILVIIFMIIIVWALAKDFLTEHKNARNEYRTCGHCGMRVPYKSAICPYCRRNVGWDWAAEGRMFKNSFGFKVIKVIFVLLAICAVIVYLLG